VQKAGIEQPGGYEPAQDPSSDFVVTDIDFCFGTNHPRRRYRGFSRRGQAHANSQTASNRAGPPELPTLPSSHSVALPHPPIEASLRLVYDQQRLPDATLPPTVSQLPFISRGSNLLLQTVPGAAESLTAFLSGHS
jgi:hypothetical protein